MDPMSGCDIRLVFTFPPRDSTLQYKRCVLLWNDFCCIITLAQTFYMDRLSRHIVSRHAMLRFHVMFFDWHLTHGHLLHSGVKFYNSYRNTPILNINHNIYEFCLFSKILYLLFKGSWNILEYRCLLIGRVHRTCSAKNRISWVSIDLCNSLISGCNPTHSNI